MSTMEISREPARRLSPDELKSRRKDMGWTQAEAARQLGMSRVHYVRLETEQERADGRDSEISRTVELATYALKHLTHTRLPLAASSGAS